jgi:hypothetical protein
MRKKWYWIAPIAIAAITLLMYLGGEVVMHLWNWLLPPLFGWHTLTFWQALGLLVLSRILFGRLGGRGPGGGRWRRRWDEKFEHLTPEERERFKQGMRGRCGWGAREQTEAAPSQTPGQ